jgi:hypothetical protein
MMLPTYLLVSLFILGVYRGTRFVTRDELPIFKFPRDVIVAFFDPAPEHTQRWAWAKSRAGGFGRSVAYLVECDWCVSVYVAGAAAYLTWRWTEVMLWVLLALTASTCTGLVATWEAVIEQKFELRKIEQMKLAEEVRKLQRSQ